MDIVLNSSYHIKSMTFARTFMIGCIVCNTILNAQSFLLCICLDDIQNVTIARNQFSTHLNL